MEVKLKWQERLFGKTIIKCASLSETKEQELVPTFETLKKSEILGVYFSFANVHGDEVVKRLRDLYERINIGKSFNFQVVQVVLWAHNDFYEDIENSHRESLLNLPWFAVPFTEIHLKTKLSRRYRIKSGVPTLVLLDKDGCVISAAAQERLGEDPTGALFPWRPRPVEEVLKDVVLKPGGMYKKEHNMKWDEKNYSDFQMSVKGFYFSAHWCPPCKAFTPQLASVYNAIRKKEVDFEIIFVSSDRSQDSYETYIESMPWLCIPFQQVKVRGELAELYGIRGIPTLLLLDNNGHVITMEGRAEIAEDPLGLNFPWKARSVNILSERYISRLHDYPAIILFVDSEETEVQFAETVLNPIAESYFKRNNINLNTVYDEFFQDDNFLQFLIAPDCDATDLLRDLIDLDEVVPLLIALDLPARKYAPMEYGVELTIDSITEFIERFQSGQVKIRRISNETVNNSTQGNETL
ncbi:nucleoredoxin-like [Onthophagus taurus]|uniref:nucleoredoxin-like n=1 Tax=Onthophagus taurus TaxID=166361 RepID=UPI000C20C996|nr:nucleoredoxin-like [Onthophagus taurus]